MINATNLIETIELAKSTDPSRIALIEPNGITATYSDLFDRIEHYQFNPEPKRRIGVYCEKTIDVIALVLAILKSGHSYIPIDPIVSPRRAARMFADSHTSLVFFDSQPPSASSHFKVTKLEQSFKELEWSEILPIPKNEACVLFTSGTSGLPKGAAFSQLALSSFVQGCHSVLNFSSMDRFLSVAPLQFDLCMLDIFGALATGASTIIPKKSAIASPGILQDLIQTHLPSIWYTTPGPVISLLRYKDFNKDSLQCLNTLITTGERFPVKQLKFLRGKIPKCRIFNFYGPTETNVCSYFECSHSNYQDTPIGFPFPSYQVKLARDGDLFNFGKGEITIRGPSLMDGYVNGEFTDGLQIIGDQTWYRSGDLGSRELDQPLTLLGRMDQRLKRNGYLIDPIEIEITLESDPAVRRAAVFGLYHEEQLKIIAFVEGSLESTIGLRKQCAQELGEHLVPDQILAVERLTLNTNGKIDYQKLEAKWKNLLN